MLKICVVSQVQARRNFNKRSHRTNTFCSINAVFYTFGQSIGHNEVKSFYFLLSKKKNVLRNWFPFGLKNGKQQQPVQFTKDLRRKSLRINFLLFFVTTVSNLNSLELHTLRRIGQVRKLAIFSVRTDEKYPCISIANISAGLCHLYEFHAHFMKIHYLKGYVECVAFINATPDGFEICVILDFLLMICQSKVASSVGWIGSVYTSIFILKNFSIENDVIIHQYESSGIWKCKRYLDTTIDMNIFRVIDEYCFEHYFLFKPKQPRLTTSWSSWSSFCVIDVDNVLKIKKPEWKRDALWKKRRCTYRTATNPVLFCF